MDPVVEKVARAFVAERGGDPDEVVTRGGWSGPRWKLEVEWAQRSVIAHRVLNEARAMAPRTGPDPAITEAFGKIFDLLAEVPVPAEGSPALREPAAESPREASPKQPPHEGGPGQ